MPIQFAKRHVPSTIDLYPRPCPKRRLWSSPRTGGVGKRRPVGPPCRVSHGKSYEMTYRFPCENHILSNKLNDWTADQPLEKRWRFVTCTFCLILLRLLGMHILFKCSIKHRSCRCTLVSQIIIRNIIKERYRHKFKKRKDYSQRSP